MSRDKTEKKASDYYASGFNCAEAVLKATIEQRMSNVSPDLSKFATVLGGGVGGSREEMCGALSGGVLAIGLLHGRTQPGVDVQKAKDLATEFRQRFIKEFGTTNCGKLVEQFGEEHRSERCRQLTGTTARLLSELLDEHS